MCNIEIGNRIKEVRNIAKQSQQEVADALFISPSLLSMIETGKREVSNELISALAKHFKVTEEFLNTGVKPNFYNEHLLFANMLTSGIKQVFPIFKCSIDIKNKSFNTAYKQQEVIYKRIKDDEEVNPAEIVLCLELYYDAWKKQEIVEAVANMYSLLLLTTTCITKSCTLFEKIYNAFVKERTHILHHNTYGDITTIHYRSLFAKETYNLMTSYQEILSENEEYSDVAKYYYALHSVIGYTLDEEDSNTLYANARYQFHKLKEDLNVYSIEGQTAMFMMGLNLF